MNKFFFCCVLPCFLAGIFTGCNAGRPKDSDNKIRFDTLTVERTYHFFDVDTNPKCSLQISYIYPVDYPDSDILNLLLQQFASGFFGDEYASLSTEEAVGQYVQDFVDSYKENEKDFKNDMDNHDEEINMLWYVKEESASNQIVYDRNNLLSMVVYKTFDYGGAHGGHQYTNRVLDLKTGRRITEDEIFMDDYQDDLAKIIIDVIASTNNVEIAELANIGFFDVDEIYPNKNFYMDETGITYTFNEYEIAAYVVGAVHVPIPYDNIRHLLRKESPVSAIAFR